MSHGNHLHRRTPFFGRHAISKGAIQIALDDLDKLIAEQLKLDARQSSKLLSKRLRVSASTIRRRVNNLIKKKDIVIVALLNPISMGDVIWTVIGLNVTSGSIHKVADTLINYPCLRVVSESLGRFDIVTYARFKSLDELNEFVFTELSKISGITHVETLLLSAHRKYYDICWPSDLT